MQAFRDRLLDTNEVLADTCRAKPHGALSAMGSLPQARAYAVYQRVPTQHDGDFGVSRQLRRQFSGLVAPSFREKMRPSPVIRRLEHSAGNILIDRIAKHTHREALHQRRDV
jgi:hypothetical protein